MKQTKNFIFRPQAVGLALALASPLAMATDPGTFVVTSAADSGAGSLRAAIDSANAYGNGATLIFDASLAHQTITLGSTLPTIQHAITINSGSVPVTVDGANAFQVLNVDAGGGAAVSINALTIADGLAQGAVGTSNGGGGGAGLGGGLFVNSGAVNLTGVSFTHNGAIGGDGAAGGVGGAGGAGGAGRDGSTISVGGNGADGGNGTGGTGGTGGNGDFGGGGAGGSGSSGGPGGSGGEGGLYAYPGSPGNGGDFPGSGGVGGLGGGGGGGGAGAGGGGGGGGGAAISPDSSVANGGQGWTGGYGSSGASGGSGGFGGGRGGNTGSASDKIAVGGAGGFSGVGAAGGGGGSGGNGGGGGGGGGGGAGFGGAVFVNGQNGASLTLSDPSISGGYVGGGSGGSGGSGGAAGNYGSGGDSPNGGTAGKAGSMGDPGNKGDAGNSGDAAGSGLFLYGGTLNINVSSGATKVIEDGIADAGAIGQAGGINKQGAGELVLTGNNSYGGGTHVQAGTLTLASGGPNYYSLGTGMVTVETGARLNFDFDTVLTNDVTLHGTLSGSGGLSSALTIGDGAVVSPGHGLGESLGAIVGLEQTWGQNGHYHFEIADFAGSGVTGWDMIKVDSIILSATPTNPFYIDLVSLLPNGSARGQSGNFNSSSSYHVLIAEALNGISGFNAADFSINSSGFANPTNGGTWSISAGGVPENYELYLDFTPSSIGSPLPEPSTLSLFALGGLLARLRRKA